MRFDATERPTADTNAMRLARLRGAGARPPARPLARTASRAAPPAAASSGGCTGLLRRRPAAEVGRGGSGAPSLGWRGCAHGRSVPARAFAAVPPTATEDNDKEPDPEPAATSAAPVIVSPINIPNALTLSRIVATPVFIHWINCGYYDLVLGGFFAAVSTKHPPAPLIPGAFLEIACF